MEATVQVNYSTTFPIVVMLSYKVYSYKVYKCQCWDIDGDLLAIDIVVGGFAVLSSGFQDI